MSAPERCEKEPPEAAPTRSVSGFAPRAKPQIGGEAQQGLAARIAGRYEVVAPLGIGGMGIVHKARDRANGQLVAIKRPRARKLDWLDARLDPTATLLRESLVMAQLDHPHVVRLPASGFDEQGAPFLVLQLLDGARTIVSYARSVPRQRRIQLLVEMFAALAHVHGKGLTHRDVKPSNVLVARAEVESRAGPLPPQTYLIDFGLATNVADAIANPNRSGGPWPLVGSALYLAPELVQGHPGTCSSDLYACGLIAAEVLTGTHPLRCASVPAPLAVLRDFPSDWLRSRAAGVDLDPSTMTLLQGLLARDPSHRISSAEEALLRLREMERIR
jgi:serine/threonine protein kinase